jgi:hypothetical protein
MVVFFTVLNHTFPPYLPFQVTEGKTIVPVEVFYILGCLSKLLECGFANKCHIITLTPGKISLHWFKCKTSSGCNKSYILIHKLHKIEDPNMNPLLMTVKYCIMRCTLNNKQILLSSLMFLESSPPTSINISNFLFILDFLCLPTTYL